MKNYIFTSCLFALSYSLASAYGTYLNTSSANALWSVNTNWYDDINKTVPESAPNGNTQEIDLWWSSKSLNVDGDYTIKMLGANRDTGCDSTIKGLVNINMTGTKSDGTDGSITFDLANNTSGYAIDISTSAYLENAKDLRFVFNGGTINFTDTTSDTVRTAIIHNSGEANSVGKFGTDYTKTMTFSKTTTINSTENLAVQGWRWSGAGPLTTFNFEGAVNLVDSSSGSNVYRNFTINGGDSAATTLISTTNFGKDSTLVASSFVQKKNTESFLNGKATINNTNETPETNALAIDSGAKMTINGELTINATKNAGISVNGELILNGTLNYNKSFTIYGKATINSGAKMTVGSSDPYIMINGGTLTLNDDSKNLITTNRGVRMQNGSIILNGDALASNMMLWMVSNYNDKRGCYVEVNTDVQFGSFSWIQGNRTVIKFGEEGSLTLNSLSAKADTWGSALTNDVLITLQNYENGDIRVAKLDGAGTADDLSLISAEGYEDGSFKFVWHEETKNYWLEGVAVPEPAAFAAIFGALALAFIAYKRK